MLIDFFAEHVKPVRLRGIGLINPTTTSKISENLYVVRDADVNFYLYQKGNNTIAFDCGYRESSAAHKLQTLGIDPHQVTALFLTHGDVDHAGGVTDGAARLFPNAELYYHRQEIPHVRGQMNRFQRGFIGIKNPIRLTGPATHLDDGEVLQVGDIQIEIFHVPGHTPGHLVYLVDKTILVSGDTLLVNQEGGYCFAKFFNMDTIALKQSLVNLERRLNLSHIEYVCTGHSGVITGERVKRLFAHRDKVAHGTKRHPFDATATLDPFDESLEPA